MRRKEPTTYKEWMDELNCSGKPAEMKFAAMQAYKLNPNKKKAYQDIAVVLCEMYRRDMTRVTEQPMVIRAIKEKFDDVAGALFRKPMLDVLNEVKAALPNFDARATIEASGQRPLGFLKAASTVDEKGAERSPLGFVSKPRPRTGKNGKPESSLGFLGDDTGTRGGLGFL